MKQLVVNYRMPLYGGILTAVFSGLAIYLLGNLSGYEASLLIETSIPRISTLFNTIILASATILALILTLLGISSGSESKLKKYHYKQVLSLARFDSFLFIATLICFQILNIPITEAENVPYGWFGIIYYVTLFISSLLSGLMVAVILMLYKTIHNIIIIVGLKEDHPLVDDEEEVESKEDMDEVEDEVGDEVKDKGE